MKIIAVANHKGGVGKTTTVANLSACLAKTGVRVLAIDLDSQAHLTMHYGIAEDKIERSIYDVMANDVSINEVIINLRPGLDLVPAKLDMAMLDLKLAGVVNRDQQLRRRLRDLKAPYDYVLIDCPPALSFTTLNAFTAANVLLICVQTQMFSFSAVERLLETVNDVVEQYDLPMAAYALPTMYEKRSNSHNAILQQIQKHFGPSCLSPIHKNVRVQDAQIAGRPVIEHDRTCSATVDYTRLAKEIRHELEAEGLRRANQQKAK